MLAEQRYKEILSLLGQKGSVKTSELCRHLGASRETVRRDFETMEDRGMLKRIHGGAMAVEGSQGSSMEYTSFERRKEENPDSKEMIAERAADFIAEGQAVALDSGTTSLALARVIKRRFKRLTVVTNSLAVVNELADAKGITLVATGGVYRADEEAFVSDIATLIFSKINVDTFFLTTCGISVERGITYQRMDEITVQNKMMEGAGQTIVIADNTKLGVNSLVRMCGIEEIAMIITDPGISEAKKEIFERAGVRVVVSQKGRRVNDEDI